MRSYSQFSPWIAIILVKIYIFCIIINRDKNTFELVGTVLKCAIMANVLHLKRVVTIHEWNKSCFRKKKTERSKSDLLTSGLLTLKWNKTKLMYIWISGFRRMRELILAAQVTNTVSCFEQILRKHRLVQEKFINLNLLSLKTKRLARGK